eukprot:scaffold8679_cov121-Isochrysis_galbana.AAC.1
MGCGANAPSPSGDPPIRSRSGDEALANRFTFTGDSVWLPPGEAAAVPPAAVLLTEESGTPHSRRALRTGWWSQSGVGHRPDRAPASHREAAAACAGGWGCRG